MAFLEHIPTTEEVNSMIFAEDKVVLITEAVERNAKKTVVYMPTGFSDFDEVIDGGLTDGDLVTIAGKTGEGKTSFGQTMTFYLNKQHIPTLWFSYEVSLAHLWKKFEKMGLNNHLLTYVPMKMTSGRLDWVESKVKEAVLKFKTKIVFIDHLGFLLPRADNMNDLNVNYSAYLGNICRQLKTLAVDREIVIVLMAHVRKTDKELEIDDLANSSGIGQESDLVFMMERQKKKDRYKEEGFVFTNETKIKLVKNRRTGQTKFITCVMSNELFSKKINDYPLVPPQYVN